MTSAHADLLTVISTGRRNPLRTCRALCVLDNISGFLHYQASDLGPTITMSLYNELKRRNVFRVAIAYLAGAWLLIEVAGTLFPAFGIPVWVFRFLVIVFALGFIPVLIISWAYEMTPEGLKREKDVVRDASVTHVTAKRLDGITIGLIVVALAFILVDRIWLDPRYAEQSADPIVVKTDHEQTLEPEATDPQYPPNSIAVLPFANRSANPDDAFFVDGIHDDLLTYISQIGSIKTISRTSVMQYRDSTKAIPEIARELGVSTVLEGGVQRAGEHVRINVQLIDARTDDHVWSKIYDRQLTAANIFSIQSEVAESVAEALRATLTPEARERIDSVPTENLAALEAYFLGRQRMATRTVSDLARAVEHFEAAVERDPAFALAYVGLADTYLLQASYGGLTMEEGLTKSRAAAERALQLEPLLGEAYASVAKRRDWEGDYEEAEVSFKRALELNPNYAPAYQWYGEMLSKLNGRMTEALESSRRSVELDPNSAIIVNDYGETLEYAGRLEEALANYRQAVEIEPRFATGYWRIGALYATRLGRLDNALAALHKGLSIEPDNWWRVSEMGLIYLELGDLQQAESWRDRALALAVDVVPDVAVALHTYRGEDDAALAYAKKDLESGSGWGYLRSLRLIRDHEIRNGNLAAARIRFEQNFPELFDANTLNIDRDNREAAVDLAYLLLQTGERAQAELLLDQSEAAIALGRRITTIEAFDVLQARIHALRGDKASAIAALRHAVDEGWRWSAWYFLEYDPVLAPLHADLEFQNIKAVVKADLAEQLARVREWESSGDLPAPTKNGIE